MRWLVTIVVVILLSICHVISLGRATDERKMLPKDEMSAYVFPSRIVRIASLGFESLVSDFLFLQATVFVGATYERKETPRIKEWEWKWLYNTLNTITDLDPYFSDPYYFANGHLAWSGGMVREANELLEKGSGYRNWDPFPPFFIGFNYFYFLHDNEKASEWLMKAARKPGANPLYASLAAKLALKERKTENAILFLEEVLRTTEDDSLRKDFETRIEALKAIDLLERAVAAYRKKFGKLPSGLDALVRKRIITAMPHDPYGGTFYIDPQGNVRSTSDFLLMPAQRK